MWPRWMPSVARARTAARFDARPTDAAIAARLLRVGDAEDAERQPRRRVDAERPADGAEGHRQLEAALEVVASAAPDGQGRVAPRAGRERVGACLDGAPVVAGRDHDGVDAVHDALVVRGRAVRIELREARRVDDAVDDVRRRSMASVARTEAGTRHVTRTQRWSQRFERMRSPTRPPAMAARRSATRLGDGVDEVGPHRVVAVDDDVDDEDVGREDPRLDLARAATARDEAGDGRVGEREQLRRRGDARARPRAPRRWTSRTWTWAIIRGGIHLGDEPAAGAHHLGRVGRRGDDARLLDDHRARRGRGR